MKERPILFSDAMVRAILDGTKTQTRRVVKVPYPGVEHTAGCYADRYNRTDRWTFWNIDNNKMWAPVTFRCPYGVPGDRLWVREAWAPRSGDLPLSRAQTPFYRATLGDAPFPWGRWRPSIHMPRWASRITLDIVDVRVQRLQDISEEDARAEGVSPCQESSVSTIVAKRHDRPSFVCAYADLWDRINGTGAWGADPWVWAITFKRAEESR